jgi:hypothetical protein
LVVDRVTIMQRRNSLLITVALLAVVLALPNTAATYSAFSGTTSNTANFFSAAADFCNYMAPLQVTGFEHGTISTAGGGLFSSLNQTAGTATADTTVVRTGTYALKLVKNSGGSAYIGRSLGGATPTVATVRVYIRLPSLPSATVADGLLYMLVTGSDLAFSYNAATNRFTMGFDGFALQQATSTASANTWYRIDMRVNTSANPHRIDWQVDGVAQSQAIAAQSAGTIDNQVGFGSSTASDAFTAYYDDLVVTAAAADYPIGDGGVSRIAPTGVGTSNDPGAVLKDDDNTAWGSTSWQRLDDLPLTATGDYLKQIAVDTGAYLRLTLADTTRTCIHGVSSIVAFRSSSTTANSAKTSIYDGSTERVVYSGPMNPGATLTYESAMIAPATGTWTQAKLNALNARIGYASSVGSVPYWDAVMAEYAWAY